MWFQPLRTESSVIRPNIYFPGLLGHRQQGGQDPARRHDASAQLPHRASSPYYLPSLLYPAQRLLGPVGVPRPSPLRVGGLAALHAELVSLALASDERWVNGACHFLEG